ncbi:MAG TPA: GNAT family protein, partial [Micromonosporaceae bacterium]
WIIRDASTGAATGTTSYYGISEFNETVAIGHTQVARDRWRTAVNTEAKLLLLTRAFETLGAGRVEWHTDDRNERSQAAIARLGAQREGVLRRHKRRADGTWRDTVQYAMTIDDWPAAKKRLVERLAAGNTV